MVRARVLATGATVLMLLALLAILVLQLGRSRTDPKYVDGATPQKSEQASDLTASIESPHTGPSRNEVRPAVQVSDATKCDSTPSPADDDIDLELSGRDLTGEKWNGPWVQFDSADRCVEDRAFNPNGIELTPEELERLGVLIGRLNSKLRTAQDQIDSVAQSHLQEKINAGQAQELPAGAQPDWKALGSGGLPMGRSANGLCYYVKLFEGEFADLDHSMYLQSALTKIGEQRISKFFQ